MGERADAVEGFTPEMIGHAFVKQFYCIVHQNPGLVHMFFQDTSSMTRPGPDGSVTTVTTMKGIDDLMLSLDSKDYKAEIMTADSQSSYNDGLMVLVTGCITGKGDVRRKFTESFFLSPQSNGYYVLNDVFRFVEEDIVPAGTSVEVESAETAATCTLANESELVEVVDKSFPNHPAAIEPVPSGGIDVSDKSSEQLAIEKPEVTKPSVNQVDDQVDVESSSDIQGMAKISYASIVKDRKENKSTPLLPATSTNTMTLGTNSAHQSCGITPSLPEPQASGTALTTGQQFKEAANPAIVPESSIPNGNIRPQNDTDKLEDMGCSIYLGNLPYYASVQLVEEEFKKFGPIKHRCIQIRYNQDFCYGFVEFEYSSSAQQAIKASPVQIGGCRVYVEEKRSTNRVINGVTTLLSGRGGYRSNGFQGRGNFSGGCGYGRNVYERRTNHDYMTCKQEVYHRVYQNRGGRALRQGGPMQ